MIPERTTALSEIVGLALEGFFRSSGPADGRGHRPHLLALSRADPAKGHGKHDNQGQAHAHLHLGHPPDRVAVKAHEEVDA